MLHTMKSAAEQVGMSQTRFWNWAWRYKLLPRPRVRVGRRWLYSDEAMVEVRRRVAELMERGSDVQV